MLNFDMPDNLNIDSRQPRSRRASVRPLMRGCAEQVVWRQRAGALLNMPNLVAPRRSVSETGVLAMTSSISGTHHRDHDSCPSTFRVIALIIMVMALMASLAACEKPGRPNATRADYAGIWACYESSADGDKVGYEIGKGINQFLVINEDGSAHYLITMDGGNLQGMECRWHETTESKSAGTDSGIALVGDGFENPFTYYDTGSQPMETHFIDKRLVKGNLVVDYGNRKDYFEKVSNDPGDPRWTAIMGSGSAPTGKAAGIPDGAIDWTEAKAHIGEVATVYGPVKDSSYLRESNEQPTYIDIGTAYPDNSRVSMVVWGEDRGNFQGDPESMYLGKTVCVTGELYAYDNVTYMKVARPDQIQVL